jgi:hypothetical protein
MSLLFSVEEARELLGISLVREILSLSISGIFVAIAICCQLAPSDGRYEIFVSDPTYDMIIQGSRSPRDGEFVSLRSETDRFEPLRRELRTLPVFRLREMRETPPNRRLVDTRQVRHMAGLDTSEIDAEISRRILRYPGVWGWVGRELGLRGWVDDMDAATRLPRTRRLFYSRYPWTEYPDSPVGSRRVLIPNGTSYIEDED